MNYGCRHGFPHDLEAIHQDRRVIVEVCKLCNKHFRWKKDWRGRVDNVEYLKAHARNFAQKGGRTKRLYHLLYNRGKIKIIV